METHSKFDDLENPYILTVLRDELANLKFKKKSVESSDNFEWHELHSSFLY